jgi:hypothetical protein
MASTIFTIITSRLEFKLMTVVQISLWSDIINLSKMNALKE